MATSSQPKTSRASFALFLGCFLAFPGCGVESHEEELGRVSAGKTPIEVETCNWEIRSSSAQTMACILYDTCWLYREDGYPQRPLAGNKTRTWKISREKDDHSYEEIGDLVLSHTGAPYHQTKFNYSWKPKKGSASATTGKAFFANFSGKNGGNLDFCINDDCETTKSRIFRIMVMNTDPRVVPLGAACLFEVESGTDVQQLVSSQGTREIFFVAGDVDAKSKGKIALPLPEWQIDTLDGIIRKIRAVAVDD